MKRCTACQQELPLAEFYPRKGRPSGTSTCKACTVAKVTAWRQRPEARQKVREANRRYAMTEKGRERRLAHERSERRRQQMAAWRISEAGKEAQRRANQSEAGKARAERYFASERGKAAVRRKQQTPLGKANAARSNHKRRMVLAGLSTLTAAEWESIKATQMGACAYCLTVAPLTMDHYEPLSRGGQNTPENVVGACRPCNSSKKAQTVEGWIGLV